MGCWKLPVLPGVQRKLPLLVSCISPSPTVGHVTPRGTSQTGIPVPALLPGSCVVSGRARLLSGSRFPLNFAKWDDGSVTGVWGP